MRTMTYRDALREAIREEMLRDERVFILGEDIAGYGGTYAVTKGLFEEFGEKRVRDTPLAEEVITGAAIGAATRGQCQLAGRKPRWPLACNGLGRQDCSHLGLSDI